MKKCGIFVLGRNALGAQTQVLMNAGESLSRDVAQVGADLALLLRGMLSIWWQLAQPMVGEERAALVERRGVFADVGDLRVAADAVGLEVLGGAASASPSGGGPCRSCRRIRSSYFSAQYWICGTARPVLPVTGSR